MKPIRPAGARNQLGFVVVAGTLALAAKVLFFLFLIAFVVSIFIGGRPAPPA
jgi:uncharacterized membrane protein YtjA (UPF0391 family)